MYLLPLPELTLNPEFQNRLLRIVLHMPDAAWSTTPSGLTQWSHVLGPELEMFRNKFSDEGNDLIKEFRYFRIFPKTTVPPHKDQTRNSLVFFTLNPEIDHTLNFKNGRNGETILSYKYSDVPVLVDVKTWHEAVNRSSEYRMAVIACCGGVCDGGFRQMEVLYKKKKLLTCQDQPNTIFKFPWDNEGSGGYMDD